MKLGDLLRYAVANLGIRDVAEQFYEEVAMLGSTQRFRTMDNAERYFLGLQYSDCKANWDGQQAVGIDRAMQDRMAHISDKPPYSDTPFYLRNPYVKRQLCPSVIHRLTGLLFGENLTPNIKAKDPQDQQFIDQLLKTTKWWLKMNQARDYGGGVGSVALGVSLLDGDPVVEVVNGKFCTPIFKYNDANLAILEGIRIVYMRPITRTKKVLTNDGREVVKVEEDVEYFLRIVTKQSDVQMVSPDGKDAWEITSYINHGLGYVPWVWIKNSNILNDVDGKPDCDGTWETLNMIDALLSQGAMGVKGSCDPTPVFTLPPEAEGSASGIKLGVGRGNAVVLPAIPGVDVAAIMLETSGAGGEIALKYAAALKDAALEDIRCVLDEGKATGRSATELVKRTQAMYEHASELRQMYGPAMEQLLEMLLKIIRKTGVKSLPDAFKDIKPPKYDDVEVVWASMVQMTPQEQHFLSQMFGGLIDKGVLSRDTVRNLMASTLGITDLENEAHKVHEELEIFGAPKPTVEAQPDRRVGFIPEEPDETNDAQIEMFKENEDDND